MLFAAKLSNIISIHFICLDLKNSGWYGSLGYRTEKGNEKICMSLEIHTKATEKNQIKCQDHYLVYLVKMYINSLFSFKQWNIWIHLFFWGLLTLTVCLKLKLKYQPRFLQYQHSSLSEEILFLMGGKCTDS